MFVHVAVIQADGSRKCKNDSRTKISSFTVFSLLCTLLAILKAVY